MKFKVTMKDADTLYDAIQDAVDEQVSAMGLDEDEADALKERRREKISDLCGEWFRYGEYLTVEIDTDAKTCVVVSLKD